MTTKLINTNTINGQRTQRILDETTVQRPLLELRPTLINIGERKLTARIPEYEQKLLETHPNLQVLDVTSDSFTRYPYPTLLINPHTAKIMRETGELWHVSLWPEKKQECIKTNKDLLDIIQQLLNDKQPIFLLVRMNDMDFDFENNKLVKFIAPSKETTKFWLNKKTQLEILSKAGIPTANFKIVKDEKEFWETVKGFNYNVFMAITQRYSCGGDIVSIATSKKEIQQWIEKMKEKEGGDIFKDLIICEKLDVAISPSVGAITDGKETLVIDISEQLLKNGTIYAGTTWPLSKDIEKDIVNEIVRITKEIGRQMNKTAYKGIFNVDFIITREGKVYFAEINPRTFGHHTLINKTGNILLPKHQIDYTFPEMEIDIANGRTFKQMNIPIHKIEQIMLDHSSIDLAWTTNYLCAKENVQLTADLQPFASISDILKRKKVGIYDYPGKGIIIQQGSLAFYMLSAASTRKEAVQNMENNQFFNKLIETHNLE